VCQTMPETPAIQTQNLSKRFGRIEAVSSLDLTVKCGEIFGFLGPNGAGKTTTIRMLMGLVRPSAGQAFIFGRPASSPQARADGRVGALVETPAFYEYLSARANLALFAELSGGADVKQIDTALEQVGLRGRERDKVRAYSHGMRQRLALAQALLPLPRLLVVDEPALGLDPQGLADVRKLLIDLNRQHGVTIFLSSHLLHEVEQMCTDVGVIINGRLVARGKVEQLLSQPEAKVELRVDDAARAAQELAHMPGVIRAEVWGASVSVVCPRGAIPDINELLVERGIRVQAIKPCAPTLEELYMQLMKGGEDANRTEAGTE